MKKPELLPNDIHGLKIQSTLKGLRPVLQEWIHVVAAYSASYKNEGDVCYWYNERTSVGMLAAAAWRQEWVALEEFTTRKAHKESKGTDASGRCDLKISNSSASYAIEAKQAWQPIGSRVKDPWRYVNQQRIKATEDARNLFKDQGSHRLGVVFATPRLKVSDAQKGEDQFETTTTLINEWLSGLQQLKNVEGYAYIFPARNRRQVGHDDRYIWPGTLMLLKQTRRRR